MRFTLAFFLLISTGTLSAQNWAVLDPANKYGYSNDGSDTISAQVFVTRIDTLGPDSFRLGLNRIAEPCANCATTSVTCDNSSGILNGEPQFLGGMLIVHGADVYLIGTDTLLLRPHEPLGASWPGLSGGTASIDAVAEQSVLGVPDSVKDVQFADGRTLRLSKEHGLIAYADPDTSFDLVGIQGGAVAGVHYPEIIDFFDYQPGDVLQYDGASESFDGTCYHHTSRKDKYTMLTRTELPGRTDYQVRHAYSWYSYSNGGCGGDAGNGVDTLLLVIEHSHWTPGNFLATGWLTDHWPGALASIPENTDYFPFSDPEAAFIWKPYKNGDGRIVLEPGPNGATGMRCFDDSLFWGAYFEHDMNRYIEGIGLDSAHILAFEHAEYTDLIGYTIDGVTHGTILSDSEILLVSEHPTNADHLVLSPNPADGTITLDGAVPGDVIHVLDATGRSVMTKTIGSMHERLPIDRLPEGAYVLSHNGGRGERFIIAR